MKLTESGRIHQSTNANSYNMNFQTLKSFVCLFVFRKEKKKVIYKGSEIRMTLDFSRGTLETRK